MKAPTTIQIHSPLSYCWLTAGAGTWWWPQTAVGICVVARVISATRQTQSAAHETPPCETSPAKSPNCKDAWLASFADHVEHSPLDSQDGTPQATSEMIARDDGALAPTSLTVHTVTPCKINYVWQRITTCGRDLPPTTRPFIKTPATLLDSQPPHPIAPHVGSVSSIDPPAGAGTGTEPRSCSAQRRLGRLQMWRPRWLPRSWLPVRGDRGDSASAGTSSSPTPITSARSVSTQ